MKRTVLILGAALGFASICLGQAQVKGTVERVKVHGKSLEGNLEGDNPDRDVAVYLPPTYNKDTKRRYPVLYLLHGFTDSAAKWFGFEKHWISFPAVMDEALAQGATKELIVVMPDAYTRFKGSMYSNSVTTGDWEDYVSHELVAYVDAHYRTIASAASRGLAGHSMGGYGAMRIGMKHQEVFSSIYLLSPLLHGTVTDHSQECRRHSAYRIGAHVRRCGESRIPAKRAACLGSRVVAGSEKPSFLYRSAVARWPARPGGRSQVRSQRAARDDRPIHPPH